VIYVWYDNEYGYSAQVLRLLGHSIGMRRPHLPSASVLD
jgi:glyceraldehyde 3-phosphate dehydrogenase